MIRTLITSVALAGAITGAGATELQEGLTELFEARYGDASATPGGAVIIAKGDTILFEYYTGLADLTTGKKIGPETTFNIASVSKQFTVVGLLELVAKGLVDLDAPMARYVDYPQAFWNEVTPRDLASQSSGIPDTRDRSDREKMVYATDSSSMAYFPSVRELKFKPGKAYDYVNPTFLLLAKIIEDKTGKSFVDYQRENIFAPAGMDSTYYFDPSRTPLNQSHAYEPDGEGWKEYDYGEETFFATRPDGGLYSTARDMLRWESALACNILIPERLKEEAYTPRADVGGSEWCDYQRRPGTWYGLGWFIESNPGRPLKVYHTGDNGGYQAYVAKYPKDDVRVIVLENRHDQDRWQMAEAIERLLLENGLLGAEDR